MHTIRFGTLGLVLSFASLGACDVDDGFDEDRVVEDEIFEIEADQTEAEAMPHSASDSLADEQQTAAAGANFYEPVGTLDRADCTKIAGWVKDGDTTAPTWASIRTAPWPGGVEVATPVANLYRGDLPFPDKNHGFSINTPAWLKDGVTRTIYVHGINVDTNGNWDVTANSPLLNLSGKQICCGTGCFGGPEIPPM